MVDFWRQLDIVSPSELKSSVSVIGAGGIGSLAVLSLAKMGCSQITVYDDDKVEEHNLPNQLYRATDIGQPKVTALKEIVNEFTNVEIRAIQERIKEKREFNGIIITAVDSMNSRKEIWQSIIWQPAVRLYIDARMGGEVIRIYTVRPCDPDDVNFYEKSLYSDEEAIELPCTAQTIIYSVFLTASLICNQVKHLIKGEKIPKEIVFDFKTLIFIERR